MRRAILILSWNGADDLAGCLAAVQRQNADTVLVVDNGSQDASRAVVQRGFPWARLIANGRNLGFGGGMNVGLRALMSDHDVVVLLNQDTQVDAGWLDALTAPLDDPAIGAVGCKIHYPDGQTLQHAGGVIDPGRLTAWHIGHGERDAGQHDTPRDCAYLTGAALALRTTLLRGIGLFDEGYAPAYYEDVDLCWRMRRAGALLRYEPRATLRHAESRSTRDVIRRAALMHRNRLRFAVKTSDPAALDAFIVAERARLAVLPQGMEARALRRAYLAGILDAPEWIAARRAFYAVSARDETRITHLCALLRREMVEWVR